MEETELLLFQYGALRRKSEECREAVRELTAEKYACIDIFLKGPRLDGIGGKRGENDDPVCRIVQKMADIYDGRIARAVEKLEGLYTEFDKVRDKLERAGLNEAEKKYVELRYAQGKNVADIAEEIGYSERQTQRLRNRILRVLAGGREYERAGSIGMRGGKKGKEQTG